MLPPAASMWQGILWIRKGTVPYNYKMPGTANLDCAGCFFVKKETQKPLRFLGFWSFWWEVDYLLECWLTKWKVFASVQNVDFRENRNAVNWVKAPYLVQIQCEYYTLTWFVCQCVNIVTVWFFVGFLKKRKKSGQFGYWIRQDSQGEGVPGIWSKDAFIMRKTAIRKRFCVGFYVGFLYTTQTFSQ